MLLVVNTVYYIRA